jgi:hypothetical protein
MLANSGKGQHIHFILDNDPYSAHYEPSFTKDLEPGNHLLVAFLSRSYHESVKNDNSFVAKKLTVGDAQDDELANLDLTKPHLIYSRPKGTYSGEGTDKVMLDFFLLNTDLSADGNKVRATDDFKITAQVKKQIKAITDPTLSLDVETITDKLRSIMQCDKDSCEKRNMKRCSQQQLLSKKKQKEDRCIFDDELKSKTDPHQLRQEVEITPQSSSSMKLILKEEIEVFNRFLQREKRIWNYQRR